MKNINELELAGKTVVIRTDYDVPLTPSGQIIDDYRIRASIPTIKLAKEKGAKQIILVSHLGRPVSRLKEKVSAIVAGNPRLSLRPIAHALKSLLGEESESLNMREIDGIELPAYIIGRGIYLLENIRFDPRETANDGEFARTLAGLGEVYIFDAFAVSHRTHASTATAIKEAQIAAAGLQLIKEVETLSGLKKDFTHPFVCILGGAKVETKLPVIEQLVDQVDSFLLGGVMANTFVKAQGMDTKRSSVEMEQVATANDLYKQEPSKFNLPEDFVWQNHKIMDIGLKTRARFREIICEAKTIFWNGTVGVTSLTAQDFKFGSQDIAEAIAANKQALTVISGGDTVGFVNEIGIDLAEFSFVSTGGGATMEFLAGKGLPALNALGY